MLLTIALHKIRSTLNVNLHSILISEPRSRRKLSRTCIFVISVVTLVCCVTNSTANLASRSVGATIIPATSTSFASILWTSTTTRLSFSTRIILSIISSVTVINKLS
ncbi:hypothetical protein ACOSQ4_020538 [Xanthoceras sorbifolium]